MALVGPDAAIAQLVEHLIRNEGVGGSNPSCGTTLFNYLAPTWFSVASQKGSLGSTWEATVLKRLVASTVKPSVLSSESV